MIKILLKMQRVRGDARAVSRGPIGSFKAPGPQSRAQAGVQDLRLSKVKHHIYPAKNGLTEYVRLPQE